MTPRQIVSALIVTFTLPLGAQAQLLAPVDFTKRADRVGDMRFSSDTIPLRENPRLGASRFNAQEWQKSYSNVLNQEARLNQKSEFQWSEYRTPPQQNFRTRRPTLARENNRMSRMRNLDHTREMTTVSRYENAAVAEVAPSGQRIANAMDTMSLNDMNRFTFQRSTRTEAGISRTRAGTGE